MPLYRSQVRDAIVAALINNQTAAGDRVYAPRDWPETVPDLPSIIVSIPADSKTPWSVGGAKFNSTAHIVALARVVGDTALDAEAQLEQLIDQMQNAVLADLGVWALIEKFSMVDTRIAITDNGESQIGEVSIDFACDFPEVFYPGVPQPFVGIQMEVTTPGTVEIEAKATLPQP